ncbi:hypothetical protein SASPL_116176 [Salvia splendens]|uniref:Uncharacterized protein n=1 Tax=Salvia splendens TaxID=180675 RepID=A0A8X8ZWI0_SALSN|nr:hypothetical protein SASPL_116176 [Salvia splendens]
MNMFIVVFMTSMILVWLIWKRGGRKKVPPSPRGVPVLGNLHQLSLLPHRDFLVLSKKHGPLMLLHFGRVPVLVVSSADAAREIMKNQDLSLADRPRYKAHKKILYNGKDVVFAPYGEYWRQAKGHFVLKLLSNKRVQSFRPIREEETALFVQKIRESSGQPVNLSHMFFNFTYDGVCRSALGRTYSQSDKGKEFLVLMMEMTEALGAVSIGEFIPCLRWIDRINGFDKKVDRIAAGLDGVLEAVIRERLGNLAMGDSFEDKTEVDFLDILLQIYTHHVSTNWDTIKAIILVTSPTLLIIFSQFDLDMNEGPGITAHRVVPLHAVATVVA